MIYLKNPCELDTGMHHLPYRRLVVFRAHQRGLRYLLEPTFQQLGYEIVYQRTIHDSAIHATFILDKIRT